MPDLLLGLIGDNIKRSSAPRLHRLAGRQNGLDVRYDLLIPADLHEPFERLFPNCAEAGYRGLNITYPYKEVAARAVRIDDAQVRRIGAVNTVVFSEDGPRGYNTDHSGFIAAYRSIRQAVAPGAVAVIGTGGVGRAITFALLTLGATEIRLTDRDRAKAEALALDLRQAAQGTRVLVGDSAEQIAEGAAGLVNCTPVGMTGYPGTPVDALAFQGAAWAFDAVYTPINTQFLTDARSAGLQIISGYELFFYQGVDAWGYFSARPLDQARLRAELQAEDDIIQEHQ